MADVLILGGGFAGLVVAEKLAATLGSDHQITLISPSRKFTFYPALVELAFGKCTPADIQFDLSEKLRNIGVRYIQGEMVKIHPSKEMVTIAGDDINGDISYDYLVVATGRRLATGEVRGYLENAQHLLGVKAALKFGNLVENFKEGKIVVGLCPNSRLPVPVCETAFALARKFEAELQEGKIHVSVIFPESLEAAFGGAKLHKQLEAAFKRHRISVHYEVPIREISFNRLSSTLGHEIECDLVMLLPPFKGNAALRGLNITNESDFVMVDALMKVHGLERTYAVGDGVAFSGPKLAHMAVRQADVAAANIASELNGEVPTREYDHEIAAVIDADGPDSIYLRYGIWDDTQHHLKTGRIWGWAKEAHDALWRTRHRN